MQYLNISEYLIFQYYAIYSLKNKNIIKYLLIRTKEKILFILALN
jgi:hypothetical protein